MLIGIDGNEANVEKRVGISEYAFELLMQFKKLKIQNGKDGLRRGFRVYLKNKPLNHMPEENGNWKYRTLRPSKLWTQVGLPLDLYLHKPRPDVFFSPTHYAPRFSPVPTVISIMDLSYIYYPEMFKKSDLYQLRNWTAYSVRKARFIFTISKASKSDIIKTYKIPEERVVVTYPGIKVPAQGQSGKSQRSQPKVSPEKVKSMDVQKKYGIKGQYILFVGTLQPRKNLIRLIEAFSLVHKESSVLSQSDISLVIVGKKGWLYKEILQAPRSFGVQDKILFLEFIPDEDLAVLYQNARCFVLPSLYEGFGLPVLEAMNYGCPVITSSVSSLPEAGQDAALYVDPTDVLDIASQINLLLANEKFRKELIEKGYKQVKKFSWEKTARETLKVLEGVARG